MGKGAEIPETLRNRQLDLHVICNSHLDREWTENFQFTRMLTVQFIDALLKIFKQVPEYQFLLDSQTVPLEDYLEIRPENEEQLRQYVREERLWIGPWYTAPDFSCIFGESIVRNLLIGHQIARDWGQVMKVGYTPFGFGQVSQLPQIYAGFGMDIIWFYRGVSEREAPNICFRWKGADGTTAFCSRAARYNFYFGVVRWVAKGGGHDERDFDYRATQVPVHFCDERRKWEHAVLANTQTRDALEEVPELLVKLLENNVEVFPGDTLSMMNGLDTLMPTMLDHQIVQKAQDFIPDNWKLHHSNLPDFAKAFRQEIEDKQVALREVFGERRHAGDPGPEATMLGDIITARGRQKRHNAEAEVSLQRYAEPLATIAWLLGDDYPDAFLFKAWKELCKCHPHDTIGGAGIDQLEKDLMNRLDQVINIAEGLTMFATGAILKRIDTSKLNETDIPLVVLNPSPTQRCETLSAQVDIPNDYDFKGVELIDLETNQPVDFAITAWRPKGERIVRDPRDATTSFFCTHVDIDFAAEQIPALGYRTFVLRNAPRKGYRQTLLVNSNTLENDLVRVIIQPDGTLDLHDKQNNRTYSGLNQFRDRGEAGNPWTSRSPTEDRVYTSIGAPAQITVEHDSPLRATLKVSQTMRIPSGWVTNEDRSYSRRSDDLVDLPITSYITLTRDSRCVDIRTQLENRAHNHTLEVLFPTGLSNARTFASDTPFDVVERPIERTDDDPYAQVIQPPWPLLRYVDVDDSTAGLGVAVAGVRGCRVTEDRERAIALTLLRAYEISLCTVTYRWELRPDQELSQSPGRHEIRYMLVPHGPGEREAVRAAGERLNCPLLVAQSGRSTETKLPAQQAFFDLAPATVELSCLKKAVDRETLILRVYNPTTRDEQATLTSYREIASARLVSLEELPVNDGKLNPDGQRVSFAVGAKKIVTLELALK
jgi:mannosylglycerate hydrolase